MLKNILKLNGAQEMSKKELQTINGGGRVGNCPKPSFRSCADGYCCTPYGCEVAPHPNCY